MAKKAPQPKQAAINVNTPKLWFELMADKKAEAIAKKNEEAKAKKK